MDSQESYGFFRSRDRVSKFAFVPEVILLAIILWFGVALPQPVAQGVENAAGIVLQQDTKALHEAPIVKDIFVNTNQGMR